MSTKIKKITYSLVMVLLVAVLIMPLVVGIWIKHEYKALIAFYNSQNGIHIEISKYERHWFSANAELAVTVNPAWVSQLSRALAQQDVVFPAAIHFTVHQRIQNGPILYRKNKDESLSVQLAYMYSEIEFAPDLAHVIELVNNYDAPIVIVDNLSFSGKFHRIFRSAGLRLVLAGSNNKIEVRGINASISIWPVQRHIKADISTDDFMIVTENFQFAVPQIKILCDRTQSAHKLWIGTSSISLPQVYLRDSEQATLTMVNVASSGSLSEAGEMLNGTRNLTIDQVETGTQVIGPVDLRISVHNFDASMSAQIFSSYGQMLFSDQYMMAAAQVLSSLPEVVNGQSSIDIEKFTIATPNGRMSLDGKIDWPGLTAGSSLTDVFQHTHAKGLLRMAIPLANRLSQAYIDLAYANDTAAAPTTPVSPKKISDAERQNQLVIAMLVESHELPASAAAQLLIQQKNHASLDDYQLVLESFVNSKQVTAAVSDTLRAKYAAIQWMTMAPDQRHDDALKLLQMKIMSWVKADYITEDQTDYLSTITFQDGQVSVNGKVIEQAY